MVRELLRSNDMIRLSWLEAMLRAAGIETVLLDTYTSVLEGSIGAIPRRLMVGEGDHRRAEQLWRDAEAALLGTVDTPS